MSNLSNFAHLHENDPLILFFQYCGHGASFEGDIHLLTTDKKYFNLSEMI